jgi:flagellar hook protein FlgE
MISAIQTGALGMERASEMTNNAAADIANAATPPKSKNSSNPASGGDITNDAVNMVLGHRTYDANAKVIEVAAKMLDEIV